MSEFRIDVSELKRENEGWVKQLAAFLNESLKANVETADNEIILRGEATSNKIAVKKLIMAYLETIGVKGKVKKRRGCIKGLAIVKSKGKPIFCNGAGAWKSELEQRLREGGEIVLLAAGKNKYQLLSYLNERSDIEIIQLKTAYPKKREKGLGLSVTVRKAK